jgi:aspartate aminotransferase
VIITVGGKQALFNATQVLFEKGDKVIIPAPYWVSYPAQLHLAGAEPVILSTTKKDNYKLQPQDLRAALEKEEIRGLILCSPSNPTGATYSAEELSALADILKDFPDVVVLFDAMYDRLYFDADVAPDLVATAPHLESRTITFNGFSKTYAMTGWRLGYAIGPKEVIKAMGTLQSQSTSNATSFVQYGGLAALELSDDILSERREAFRRRRDLIVDALRAIDGVECPMPTGAFYAFPDFSAFIDPAKSDEDGYFADDLELTEYLLVDANVAVVPGSAFGFPGGLRLSYAMSDDLIREGVQRIKVALTS